MSEELPFGSRGGASIRHCFPVDGEYVLRVVLQRGVARGEIPKQLDVRLDGERLKLFTIGGGAGPQGQDPRYAQTTNPDLTVRFPAQAGTRQVAVTFVQRTLADEGVNPSRLPVTNIGGNRGTDRGVERVLIEGPYDAAGPGETASRRQISVCQPTDATMEAPCARTILATLAERAYRCPVLEDEDVVDTLVAFYEAGRREGSFGRGIQRALERLLVDPEFLFRIESDPVDSRPGTAYEISDLALASRVSFFLWSSIPDDELRDVARRGELRDPVVLERQVRRMLADPRSSALVNSFAAQWLYLRNLRAVTPDVNEFPEFDENLRDALQRETELFLHSQLREDRSLVELLTADYTFVNQRLAEHYQIPNVYGSHFRRVALDGTPRAGLLGQGSILTVTSYATRTSPVLRGKWLLENILGTPPPLPPPERAGPAGTRRERCPRLGPGADGATPGESGLCDVSCPHGSPRLRPRELRRHRQVADARGRYADRRLGIAARRHNVRWASRAARRAGDAPRRVRDDRDREAVDLRARPRCRVLRPAGHSRDSA